MIATQGCAGRFVLRFAHQVALSVLGTMAATALLTGLAPWEASPPRQGAGVAPSAATPALPSLTSGGKYAARAIAGDEAQPFVVLTTLPTMLPLFTAAAVPPLGLAPPSLAPSTLAEAVLPAPRIGPTEKLARTAARHDMRHAAPQASAAPTPRTPGPIVMAALPSLSVTEAEDRSLWSRSRTAYDKVAFWSDALLDRLLP